MTLAPVYDKEIRRGLSSHASLDNFGHHPIVVYPPDPFDAIISIAVLMGAPLHERNHRPHRHSTVKIRDIDTFDPSRSLS